MDEAGESEGVFDFSGSLGDTAICKKATSI